MDQATRVDELLEQAHLALLRHQKEQARRLLREALLIDPARADVTRLLEQTANDPAPAVTRTLDPCFRWGIRAGIRWGLFGAFYVWIRPLLYLPGPVYARAMPAMLGLSLMYVPLGALLYGWIGRAGRRAEVPDYTCDQLGLLVGILEGLLWVLVDMKLILAEPHLRLHGFASELVIPAIAVRTSRSLAKSLGETIKAWRFSGAEVEVPDTA